LISKPLTFDLPQLQENNCLGRSWSFLSHPAECRHSQKCWLQCLQHSRAHVVLRLERKRLTASETLKHRRQLQNSPQVLQELCTTGGCSTDYCF